MFRREKARKAKAYRVYSEPPATHCRWNRSASSLRERCFAGRRRGRRRRIVYTPSFPQRTADGTDPRLLCARDVPPEEGAEGEGVSCILRASRNALPVEQIRVFSAREMFRRKKARKAKAYRVYSELPATHCRRNRSASSLRKRCSAGRRRGRRRRIVYTPSLPQRTADGTDPRRSEFAGFQQGLYLRGKTPDVDEAGGLRLVEVTFAEGDEILGIQGVG